MTVSKIGSFTLWKEEVKWVEVDGSIVPANLVSVAHAPADRAEDGHHDAAPQDDHPAEQEQIRDEDEDHACWKTV